MLTVVFTHAKCEIRTSRVHITEDEVYVYRLNGSWDVHKRVPAPEVHSTKVYAGQYLRTETH